jgi:hypothetical protein
VLFNTLFTLCPFETKRESIFNFRTEIVFLTGQVNFVPEWPNGELVSFIGYMLLMKTACNRPDARATLSGRKEKV